ncbi:hypothetical protein ACP275_12G083200 [Erythranthe tilingii]
MIAGESSAAASSSRSGGGGATADSYIGSLISLTSKSEIRYEGILYNINTEESSIGLRNVRSFGTEGRKKDGPQVPPSDKIYEYILFRGSDIKDLQVKASPPVQTTPPINSDPAIIQSHYPRPATPPTSLPSAPTGSLGDLGPHPGQMGLPGSTFQSGLPLYQPGGNLNSWAPPPPNANASGLPMPMYWQGFYGTPNALPQLSQQSLLRPPTGLPMAPSMQQMQFSGFNASLPMPASNLPYPNFTDQYSSLVPNTSSSSLTPSFPASNLSFSVPPLQPVSLASETTIDLLSNKAPISAIHTSTPSSSLPPSALYSTSVPDSSGINPVASKPSAVPGPAALSQPNIPQPVTSVAGAPGSVSSEIPTHSLITPGHLLQTGPSTAFSPPRLLQTTQKDVEVVQVSPKQLSESSLPVVTESQPPILPLPPNARAHKPNGGAYHMRNNYRGRGGRGPGILRPVTKFTEDFDFTAMNEKFKKDEVWGHLGKSNRSQSKDGEGNENASDEEDEQDEYVVESPNIEIKPIYNKDDFFDTLSSNSVGNDPNHGRPRFSEQMKLDTETFGDFPRYRGGGRGGRAFNRGGGGGFRGSYNGRGYGGGGGGYGYYAGRGRGRGVQNRAP